MLALSFFTLMFKFFSSELHVYIIILNNVIIRKVVFSTVNYAINASYVQSSN